MKDLSSRLKMKLCVICAAVLMLSIILLDKAFGAECTDFTVCGIGAKPKTVCIGDSLTKGVGSTMGGYPAMITMNYNTVNKGVGGYTVQNVTARLSNYVGKGYTHSFVMLGTNNRREYYQGHLNWFSSNLTYLVRKLKADKQIVTLMTIPPSNQRCEKAERAINDDIRKVAKFESVGMINVYNETFHFRYNSSYYADGLHLNNLGYQKIAQTILNKVWK